MVTSNEPSSEFIPLANAAKELGVTHNYLRLLIFKKKLKGVKMGRNWVTTRIWLDECFNGIKRNNTAINDNVTPSKEVRIYDLSFSTKIILILLSLSFLSSAYQIFPIETIKRIAREIQFPVEASIHEEVRPQEIIRPVARRAISPAAKDFSEYFSSLRSHTQSLFQTTRSQVAISQNPSSSPFEKGRLGATPPFENLSSTAIEEGRLGATPPFRKGRLGGIASPPFDKGRLGGIFAFTLPSLHLPKFSLPSFSLPSFFTPLEIGRLKTTVKSLMGFSELFKSSPPPPSEIAIPRQEASPRPVGVRPLASEVRLPEEVGLQRVNEITKIVESREPVIPAPLEDNPDLSRDAVAQGRGSLTGPANLSSIRSSLLSDLQSLNQSLKNEITQDLSSLRSLYSRLSSSQQSQTRVITLTQKIDTLGEATLSNITFSGTGNSFNLKDSDIPDDLTLTGSINPSSLTVSNTLSVSGTGTSTYSGGIKATALDITSTTATSTFSNGLQLSGGCFRTSTGTCLTPASPGGANTAIQFNSNSTFGGDENNLVWDNTLKRLGLGTTTPASLLSVQGNTQISGTSTQGALIATSTLFVGSTGQFFNVLSNGLVGIGTTSPGSLLSIHGGNAQITGTTTASSLIATSTLFVGSTGQFFNVLQNGLVGIGTTSPGSLLSIHGGNAQITGTTTSSGLVATSTLFVGSSGNLFNVLQSGFIGIGTTSPSSLLSIQGIANFVSNATSTLYTTLSLPNLYSTSTIATSTFAGSLYVASSTPTQNALFAVGTSSPLLYIDRNTGRLGVGTSSPGLAFSVSGDILGSGILNLTGTGTSTITGGLNIGTLNITSATATSTFGNGIQVSAGCIKIPGGTCLKEVVTVHKTADETVNNSTTLQNDDALFLAMAANERWFFTLTFGNVGNGTADFKFGFTVPTGATLKWSIIGTLNKTDETISVSSNQASGDSQSIGAGLGDRATQVMGVVINGGTAGNLQFQWAQDVATVVDTTVKANSYLEAHK